MLPRLFAIVAFTAPLAAADADFFEKRIRPVLDQHCLKCHSAEAEKAKKLKGGLLLDSKAGWQRGGDSGPAIVPGDSARSLLLRSLKHQGDVKMPPAGKLPETVVADVEKWIKDGAFDPRSGDAKRKQVGMSVEEGRKFWAFKPVVDASDKYDIDRLVLAALEKKGLKRSPPADRSTLARRLHYDLVGLPPSPEVVDAFVNDADPHAIEKLVDRLLASPEFGERWGRHWLDVARFGESLTLRGFVLPQAWRYRDYVIAAFNLDMPFDRFIREQMAGDLLPAPSLADRQRQLVATTFLALGNNNLEEQDKTQLRMDVVDEQLDVITKGFLAQTVTCARCHDHKFDPIPTADYYALAGILRNAKAMEHANVSKWIEVPLPGTPEVEAAYKKHDDAIAAVQAKLKAERAKATVKAKVVAVADVPGITIDDAQAKKVGEWQASTHSGHYIGDGYLHDQDKAKGTKTLTFQPEIAQPGKYEVRLAYSPGSSRSAAVPVSVFSADGEKNVTVDMKANPPIDGRFVSLGTFNVEKNGQAYVIVETEGTTGHVTADAVSFVPADQPPAKKAATPTGDAVKSLEAELNRLQVAAPPRPMVMGVVEEAKIEDAKVHVRGSVHNLGAVAPRGFLTVASSARASMPAKQSGRVELADWIASRDNPLTARVIVNRAWHWLFGAGLVRTVDNFGVTGETPSHPELLDHLAARFVAEGWSIKKLVRAIVLTRTYQQASSAAVDADPENRLLSRANRRRLDAECIRDTMLVVAGDLDASRGGPTYPAKLEADYGHKPANDRLRSVYLPVFRNALPEALEAFDFADTSMVTGTRNTSTVAPQALFLMNHPFSAAQAKSAAARLMAESHADDAARLSRAYRWTLGREPSAGEGAKTLKFIGGGGGWADVFHALFASGDFRFVD